jgi:hypothetical protein
MNDVYPLIKDGKINYASAYGVLSGLFIGLEQGVCSKEQAIAEYNRIWHIVNHQESRNEIELN